LIYSTDPVALGDGADNSKGHIIDVAFVVANKKLFYFSGLFFLQVILSPGYFLLIYSSGYFF